MILNRLVEYADERMDLPPTMYADSTIRWIIRLDSDGRLEGIVPLGDGSSPGKSGKTFRVPTVRRAAGIKPRLLADNAEYVLGDPRRDDDPKKVGKVAERHRQFVALSRLCAEETQEPSVKAVVDFLDHWSFDAELLPEDLSPEDAMTFRVGSIEPAVQLTSVQRFWARYTEGTAGSGEDNRDIGHCLITGEFGTVEKRMPVPVKGLLRVGGKAENSLVAANEEAFESYGLDNSLTSPISRSAGERFGKALNHLLADEKSRIFIGSSMAYVFWTRRESGFDFASFIDKPGAESVRNLFNSPIAGTKRSEIEADDFYALALSASGARVVVRDWLETKVPEAQRRLREWFSAQEIVGPYGEEHEPLGVWRLAASAYRDAGKEMTASVPAQMIRVALNGGRLPEDLLARAVRRNVVGTAYSTGMREHVTRERAALIKLIFTSQGVDMSEMKSLNTDSKLEGQDREAYGCGRLLAELEALQRAALGQINATITDRYYGAASGTPASVFGMLVGDAQSHLSKLRKTKPGAHAAIQERLTEIMSGLDGFPSTLTMKRQGLFALGYYHQRARDRDDARAASEARTNNGGEES